jgi:hypothetical protein
MTTESTNENDTRQQLKFRTKRLSKITEIQTKENDMPTNDNWIIDISTTKNYDDCFSGGRD